MDDGGKQPHTFGSGQQRTQHPRPFFYVQPPSQPYYLYQHWQLNNPYSLYGLPGGFNFPRPCMHPYQYMQYPGFVFPHAPIYPMDHRRMFEPRFHAPPWNDAPRQPYHPQPHGRRETACSEAQTDPSDAITKLIECLDKIRGGERELDSGVASQSSGMFSPGEEKRSAEQGNVLPSAPDGSHLESPVVNFSDSTTAVYDGESSQRSLDVLSPQGCWSGGLEEELPLDSSSVHEECPELEQSAADERFLPLEKEEVTDIQSDTSVTDPSVPKCDPEELTNPILPSTSDQPTLKDPKSGDKVSKIKDPKADQNYQILKLPFESVLTPGGAGAGPLSSPAAPYYYNYLPMHTTTHERMSVLSPSLDELSSRDEMFSTDLDDVDLFPKHVYAGRRLAEVVSGSPQAAEEVEEVWLPGSKRFMCACCGKSLAKGTGRSKVHGAKMYRDEVGDSEEDGSRYVRGCEQPVRAVVRKHSAPRKSHSVPQRHAGKPWYKRGQYKDPSDPVNQEDGRDVCKQEAADGEVGEMTSSELQCRTCQDRLCREDLTTSDQGRWGDGDVIPRRRQTAPLQRQEMSTQRKVMYHRPRDEDNDDDEPPPSHWDRDMEAATSTMQHSYGLGPRGPNPPHGAQQAQGPHQPAAGPSGAPRPEEQQQQQQQQQQHHHKPFFYVQPSQPYLPMQSLQWPVPVPMPVSYNPYYGYPGLGYGMPLMPNYQPNPYMEPPGFVVPHTHLHLMDYRRMLNPQYYQTMAYHSRRFRYQHNSQTREMTSSEVQTEPLSATQRTSTPGSSDIEASRGLPVRSSSPNIPTSQQLSSALAVQKMDQSLELKDTVPSSTTSRTPPNGSFVIQTEEVRIECHTTPVGLQVMHSHETAEVSHSFSQDVVQCSSILQGRVLQDEGLCLPADQSEQALQACPDILLVGTPSSSEKTPALEEPKKQTDPPTITTNFSSRVADAQETSSSEKDLTSKNFHCKVVHLPFDPKYLDELRKMESTVWSMEETLIPSSDSLIQNVHTESHDETLAVEAEVPSADVLTVREESAEDGVPMIKMPPLTEDELEEVVPTVDCPGDEMVSEADMCPMMDVPAAEETPMIDTAEVADTPYLLMLDNSPLKAERSQHRRETTVQDHQDTSFESLPAYLPSASWLADFDNVHYCSKLPPTPKKQSRPLSSSHGLDMPSRRRKLDLEYKEQPPARKPKERYKPKGKVDRRSLSDHECCLSRNFSENAFTPYASKRERLCTRCQAKRSICTPASPGLDGRTLKRKAAPFQQRNDTLLPTCEACKSHSNKQLMRKGSSPDLCGRHHRHDTEGESSENSSCRAGPKWRAADDPRKLGNLKRPLASKQNLEKCPAVMYPKLREKNCLCNEPQHQTVAWERLRHCPHGNAIREMDENCAVPVSIQDKWRNMDRFYLTHRWQTEKSWKAVMPNPDADGSKNEARSQHLNKHKKSQPQSQGTHRKDTRC